MSFQDKTEITEDDTFRALRKQPANVVLNELENLRYENAFVSAIDYVERHRLVCATIIDAGWRVDEFEGLGYTAYLKHITFL